MRIPLKEVVFVDSMLFGVGGGSGKSVTFGANSFGDFAGELDTETGMITVIYPKGVRIMHLAQCRYVDAAPEFAKPLMDAQADAVALRKLEAAEKARAEVERLKRASAEAQQAAAQAAIEDPSHPDHVPMPDYDSDEDLHHVTEVKSGSGKIPTKAIRSR